MAKKLSDFQAQPVPKTPYICKPLLPLEGLMVVAAPSKTYKSFLAMNIAYEISEGLPVLGQWDTRGARKVLLIEQEIGPWRLQERLTKLDDERRGVYVKDNLWIASKDLQCTLDTDMGVRQIEQHIMDSKAEVVIFDPLQWFHSRDENDNSQMQQVMKVVYMLMEKHKFAAIIVHHMGKKSEFRDGRGSESMRGASVVMADCDTFVAVHRPNERLVKEITLDFTLRSAENPPPLKLQFNDATGIFTPRS